MTLKDFRQGNDRMGLPQLEDYVKKKKLGTLVNQFPGGSFIT